MIMNTQQLFYLTEIERTRSISLAAENLYMSQPNLSRVLRETEDSLGFSIFQRTRRGVQPTEKGAAFLQHAKTILREAEFMERLGPNHGSANRFRVALPRSWSFLALTQEYLTKLGADVSLEAVIRECHPRHALELLCNCDVEIALIRYRTEYQTYFSEQAQTRGLRLDILGNTEHQLLLSRENVLSFQNSIEKKELERSTELLHRDIFYPGMKGIRTVYTVDRMAQLQLLETLPQAYCWAEPLPPALLERLQLVQRPCREGGPVYVSALVCKPQCAMSQLEAGFLEWLPGALKKEPFSPSPATPSIPASGG